MINGLLASPQQMPEAFSGSEISGFEVGDSSVEIEHASPQQTYLNHLESTPNPYHPAESPSVQIRATSGAEVASLAHLVATRVVEARSNEIQKDLNGALVPGTSAEKTFFGKAAELLVGRKAAAGIKAAGSALLSNPQARWWQAEAEYLSREKEASKQFFDYRRRGETIYSLDSGTWIYEGNPVGTVRYHVRPDGVLRQIDGGDLSRVTGKELDHFSTSVQAYYKLAQTMYS